MSENTRFLYEISQAVGLEPACGIHYGRITFPIQDTDDPELAPEICLDLDLLTNEFRVFVYHPKDYDPDFPDTWQPRIVSLGLSVRDIQRWQHEQNLEDEEES